MGCSMSIPLAERCTRSSSIITPAKTSPYKGLIEGQGVTGGIGRGANKGHDGPRKAASAGAYGSSSDGAVSTGKSDWTSSGEEGRIKTLGDARAMSLRCLPAQRFNEGPTLTLSNPLTLMEAERPSNAAPNPAGAQPSLHPQVDAVFSESAMPSMATSHPTGAEPASVMTRSSSMVSASVDPHDMHLARPPPQPSHLRVSFTESADLQYTRESMLSDISDTSTASTLMRSLQDCSFSGYGNSSECRSGIMGVFFRAEKDLERRRQQVPLSIEEDLFIYDDIVISKDEARTKHWRVAGRRPPPANVEAGSDSGASGSGGSGRKASVTNKQFFSFNDFDVCVDEVDIVPMSATTARGVGAVQREPLSGPPNQRFKCVTVTNTAAKSPNTVAHFLAQSRAKEPKTNRPLRRFEAYPVLGHASRVKCIALSPTEADFASCSNEDASITLNSLGVGSEVGIFTGHEDTIINATFSPDGKYLATASKDKTMILWDVMTTKRLLTFAHPKVVICCSFGPDSKYLVSGCQDRVCRLWDTRRGREWLSYREHEGIIIAIAFSPDGNHLCSASADKSLRVWSTTTAKTRLHLRGHVGIILSCSYTSDGRHIISNDESLLRVWSAEDGSCKLSLSPADVIGASQPSPRGPKLGWTLSSAAPGAFTRLMLVACSNRFVYVLNIKTGREVTSTYCKAPVYCLTAGRYEKMACGDSFGNIYILCLT
ncbi:hypothetical protein LSCM1_05500 [Leishmania martiniquensis]|uniref:Guanine nucleotide-binding protein subunit beta-like protein n=1 Tax=Leishmania martiniquensis TaxID=1580590 RepID=A0A836HRV4_9TRYP|nr:hypothetical protein LSCM1_05500 [Leishmania martiniquensis]